MDDDADRLLAAGRGLYHAGKPAEAEGELRRAVALDAGPADAWFVLSMTYRSLAKPGEAADACRRAIERDANHAAAHNLLGILLAEAGQTSDAIDELRRSLALMPNNPDTHFNLGLLLIREGRVGEALEAWRTTVTLRPTHAGAQAMLRQYPPAAARTQLDIGTTESFVGANVAQARSDRDRLPDHVRLATSARGGGLLDRTLQLGWEIDRGLLHAI
ncbi:MAG TPA: tetratricopeptide repeat protein, partial [Pirellulales bacterium]|nr:tetratricopeptide repeat protein [Pirellulales bacterium]